MQTCKNRTDPRRFTSLYISALLPKRFHLLFPTQIAGWVTARSLQETYSILIFLQAERANRPFYLTVRMLEKPTESKTAITISDTWISSIVPRLDFAVFWPMSSARRPALEI